MSNEHTAIVSTDKAIAERRALKRAEAKSEIEKLAAQHMKAMIAEGWVMRYEHGGISLLPNFR